MFRVIIAGGRNFDDYGLLVQKCNNILQNKSGITIISGTANGADKLGEQYATNKFYPVQRFPADWQTHGKRAGYLRNQLMADNADALIAFWDGKSKGTEHMINIAKNKGLNVRVVGY